MLFANIINTNISLVTVRYFRRPALKSWPNDWVPFIWNRPEKIPGNVDTGDLVDLGQPDKLTLLPEVRNSRDLKELAQDDPLRKIFSIDHAKRSKFNKALVHEHYKKLGLVHEVDYTNSLEAKIINLTFTLRHYKALAEEATGRENYTQHYRKGANDVHFRRYRYLCDLKELHRERYERLIKALDIEPKPNLINVPFIRPFRKKQMRELAIKYARDLKEKKVEEFMRELDKEKEEFEKYKLETMKWIEEAEQRLGEVV